MNKLIAIDFETYLISNEGPRPKPVCLSWSDGVKTGLEIGMEDMEKFLRKIFMQNMEIVAHNMAFEVGVIDEHFPKLQKLLQNRIAHNYLKCTKINEQLLNNSRKNPGFSVGLATLVDYYFKKDISAGKGEDAWRMRYSELDGVPRAEWPQEAVDYAIDDSKWAFLIYAEQMKQPVWPESSVIADIYLNKMGLRGIMIDKERVKTLESELLAKITPGYEHLETLGLATKHKKTGKYTKKMKILRELLTEQVENLEKTPKGTISTTGEAIQLYIPQLEDGDLKKALQIFVDVMKYEKVLTAFVSRLKHANPLIRTQYKAVVSSGRTSSSTSKAFPSINIQQLPRSVEGVSWDIRNCCVPRPGYKICCIDYAGLELSSTAHQLSELTGRSNMLKTINAGDSPVDMHSMLAYKFMNLKEKTHETYESFVKNKKKELYAFYRQLAKPINLGFPGGIGYNTMRTLLAKDGVNPKFKVIDTVQYESSLKWKLNALKREGYPVRVKRTGFSEYQLVYDELVTLKQELYGLYPDLEFFLKEGHESYLTGETKMMKNEFGEWEKEPMYSYEVGDFRRDWVTYTQICNGLLMQSPSAIGAKRAVTKIMQLYGDSPAVHPIAFIHDEIVFEVLDTPQMHATIEDMATIMIESMQEILPSVRITVEADLMDYWSKGGGSWSKSFWKNPGDNSSILSS